MSTTPAKPPEILDKIVDLVLAHRPKPTNKKRKSSSAPQAPKPKPKKKHRN